jgi:hypothetical protein
MNEGMRGKESDKQSNVLQTHHQGISRPQFGRRDLFVGEFSGPNREQEPDLMQVPEAAAEWSYQLDRLFEYVNFAARVRVWRDLYLTGNDGPMVKYLLAECLPLSGSS